MTSSLWEGTVSPPDTQPLNIVVLVGVGRIIPSPSLNWSRIKGVRREVNSLGVVFSGSAGSLSMPAGQQSEGLADSLGAGRAAGGGRGGGV